MEPFLILGIVIAILAGLALTSLAWGFDSRDQVGDQHRRANTRGGNW